MNVLLSSEDARALIWNALTGSGTSPENAGYFTDAILDTELSGLEGHGFYWLQYYCAHLRSGKVDGKAVPQIEVLSDTSFRVDALHGFAHPAIEAGFELLMPAAKAHGVAAIGVYKDFCGDHFTWCQQPPRIPQGTKLQSKAQFVFWASALGDMFQVFITERVELHERGFVRWQSKQSGTLAFCQNGAVRHCLLLSFWGL